MACKVLVPVTDLPGSHVHISCVQLGSCNFERCANVYYVYAQRPTQLEIITKLIIHFAFISPRHAPVENLLPTTLTVQIVGHV